MLNENQIVTITQSDTFRDALRNNSDVAYCLNCGKQHTRSINTVYGHCGACNQDYVFGIAEIEAMCQDTLILEK
jgi:hypothetical protein